MPAICASFNQESGGPGERPSESVGASGIVGLNLPSCKSEATCRAVGEPGGRSSQSAAVNEPPTNGLVNVSFALAGRHSCERVRGRSADQVACQIGRLHDELVSDCLGPPKKELKREAKARSVHHPRHGASAWRERRSLSGVQAED